MTTTFDTTQFKEAMSRFATGVTIVTALEEGTPVGFSCQTFVSLSLAPPLVALAPAKTSTSWPRIARAGSFCVNVLSARQSSVCMSFAASGGDKFVGVPWHSAETGGAPIIEGTRITVRAIAGYYQLGMSVDEILQSLPHLTQSHVHAALAFYFDHQEEIDRDLERNADLDYWRKQVKQPASVVAKAA